MRRILRARRMVRETSPGFMQLLDWLVLVVVFLSIAWGLIYLMQVGGEQMGRGWVAAPGRL